MSSCVTLSPAAGGDCRAGSAPLPETKDDLRTAVAQLVVDYYALAYAADGDKPALSVAVNCSRAIETPRNSRCAHSSVVSLFRRPGPAHVDNDIQVGPSQPPEIRGSRSKSKYPCFTLGSLACS